MLSPLPRFSRPALLAAALSAIALPAHAHVGMAEGSGFAGGFLHPFTGLDHLLVLLAIGFWVSALSTGRARVAVLVGAVLATAAGGALGAAFGGLAFAAGLLFASLVAIGLLMLFFSHAMFFSPRVAVPLGCVLVLAGAVLHGYPHGSELWATAIPGAYASGFLLGSGAVVALGAVAGLALRRYVPVLMQAAAAGFAAAGLVFMAG